MPYIIQGTDRSRTGGGVMYVVATYTDDRKAEAEHYLSELRKGSSESYGLHYEAETQKQEGQVLHPVQSDVGDVGRPRSSIEVVQDIETGRNVPYSESRQAQIEENIARAAREKPTWAMQQVGIDEKTKKPIFQIDVVRTQSYQQAQGDFGQRRLNLTPSERLQMANRQAEAEKIAERAASGRTAGEILTEFRKLDPEFQTITYDTRTGEYGGTLKSIAEESARRNTPVSIQEARAISVGLGYETAKDIFSKQSKLIEESEGLLLVSEKDRQLGVSTGYISPELKVEGGLIEFNFPKSAKYSKGFESQLGTGKMPFYAKGTLGKAYAAGRGGAAKLREAWEGGVEKAKRAEGKLTPYLAPEFRPSKEKTATFRDLAKPIGKAEEKLFRVGTTFYEKGFKPSDVSLSKQVSQQDKAYQADKVSKSFDFIPFHKLREKTQEYKNIAKRGGYIVAGAGTDIARMTLGFGKYALEKPHMALLWMGAGLGAAKVIGKTATTIGFIGVPSLMAPEGQKLRTAVGIAGSLGLISLSAKGVSAAKGELQSVVARGRAVDRIIRETELPKVVPQKAGLQTPTTISPFIKRAEPIKGIERIREGDFTVINAPRGLQATRPTPGADFKGISRVPEPPKTELTEKGGITFAELGIEEGGILKPEPKGKKQELGINQIDISNRGYIIKVGDKEFKAYEVRFSPKSKTTAIYEPTGEIYYDPSRFKNKAELKQALFHEVAHKIDFEYFKEQDFLKGINTGKKSIKLLSSEGYSKTEIPKEIRALEIESHLGGYEYTTGKGKIITKKISNLFKESGFTDDVARLKKFKDKGLYNIKQTSLATTNNVFRELGIEEGGILKPIPKPKKSLKLSIDWTPMQDISLFGLRYGSVIQKTKVPMGELTPLQKQLAMEATKQGGYIGGISGVGIQLPKGSMRQGVDIDIYFKEVGKVEPFSKRALEISREYYTKQGLKPDVLSLKQAKSHIKVFDIEKGIDVADIGLRLQGKDKIVFVDGIAARHYKQITADKRAIAKFEKGDFAKLEKAEMDLLQIGKAEDITITKGKAVYRGLYFLNPLRRKIYGLAEGKAYPLLGYGGKGIIYGKPKAGQLPYLEQSIFPKLARKNIASYPQTPLETAIMTSKEGKKSLGLREEDIELIDITKEIESAAKNIKRLNKGDLPKKTKVLDEAETSTIVKRLQAKTSSFSKIYERTYGSFPDIAQRPESILSSIEQAKLLAKEGKLHLEFLPEKQYFEVLKMIDPKSDIPKESIGRSYPAKTIAKTLETGEKKYLPPSIFIRTTFEGRKIPIEKMQEVAAHELIHTKTPRFIYDIESKLNIPYKYQPTEILARLFGKPFKSLNLKRTPGDIELEFLTKEQAQSTGEYLIEGLKGLEVKDDPKLGLGIYKKGVKAVELKYHGEPQSELELSKGFRYGFAEYRPPTKVGGLRSQAYGEQIIRKAGASATFWTDYTKAVGEKGRTIVAPPKHRPKDPADLYAEIMSGIYFKKLSPKFASRAERARQIYSKKDPEIAKLFAELDKGGMKVDLTPILKRTQPTSPTRKTFPAIAAYGFKSFYPSREPSSKISVSRYSPKTSYPSLRSAYKSLYASRSRSPSPSKYKYPSQSISRSFSKSLSRSLSPSISKSLSPSISKSISPSISRSLSPSRSKSPSRSRSPSPSRTPPPKTPPPFLFRQPRGYGKPKKSKQGYGYFYRQFKVRELSLGKPIELRWKI